MPGGAQGSPLLDGHAPSVVQARIGVRALVKVGIIDLRTSKQPVGPSPADQYLVLPDYEARLAAWETKTQ